MNTFLKALLLETEAIYHIQLKSILITIGIVVFGVFLSVVYPAQVIGSTTINITITQTGGDLTAIDDLTANQSTLSYVWIGSNAVCDDTTDFNSATSYTEGSNLRLEETHNNQKICFKSVDVNDDTSLAYVAHLVSGVDRTAPIIDLNLAQDQTSISASDNDSLPTTWQYLILNDDQCDQTIDFNSAVTYVEGNSLDINVNSSIFNNRYYCFRSIDQHGNIGYQFSEQLKGIPIVEQISIFAVDNHRSKYGIGRMMRVNVHFSEAVVLAEADSNRSIYLSLNSQAIPNSLNSYEALYSDLDEGIIGFQYVVQEEDVSDSLQVTSIMITAGMTVRDVEDNDAVLTIPDGLVIVGDNDQPRQIVIDGLRPVISLTEGDFTVWSTTKTVIAVDDEENNDTYWDYYLIALQDMNNHRNAESGKSAEVSCKLGDFLPVGEHEGTSYTEGESIVLTEENNDHYLCIRSRRSDPMLWDYQDRDRAAKMSRLIQNIDETVPVVSLSFTDNKIIATAEDTGSGVDTDTFRYKVVNSSGDCTEAALSADTIDYTAGEPVTVTPADRTQFYCFGVEDFVGNIGMTSTDMDAVLPAHILSISSDKEDAAYNQGSIDILVTFYRDVTVDSSTGVPYLDLNSGGRAHYSSSNGSVLTFTYVIASGENSPDLDADAISFNNGSIKDNLNQKLIILDLPTGLDSLAESKNIVIDTTPPEIDLTTISNGVTIDVSDNNVIADNSLFYKLIAADSDCDALALASGTTVYSDGATVLVDKDDYGSRLCFTASDEAGNTTYETTQVLSKPPRRIVPRYDTTPPHIVVNNPDSSTPEIAKIVSATSDSVDVDSSSWYWKAYDPNQSSCDAHLMSEDANAYSDSQVIILNDEIYNGQSICFTVSDDSDNTAYADSEVIAGIDLTAPSIIITFNNDELTAVDDDEGVTDWYYRIIAEEIDCDQTALADAQDYEEGTVIRLGGQTENYKVCLSVTDSLGHTNYQASVAFVVDGPEEIPAQVVIRVQENDEPDEEHAEDEQVIEQNQVAVQLDGVDTASGLDFWRLLLALILFFLIFFFIKRRRDEDEDEEGNPSSA